MKIIFHITGTEIEFEVNLDQSCAPPVAGDLFQVRGKLLTVVNVPRVVVGIPGQKTHYHHHYLCNCKEIK